VNADRADLAEKTG